MDEAEKHRMIPKNREGQAALPTPVDPPVGSEYVTERNADEQP